MGLTPLGIRCAVHPADRAVDVCSRCGGGVCGQCVRTLGGEVGCAPCAARPAPGVALPGRVPLSLAMAVAGLLFPLAAPVAVALTWNASERIRRERYSLRAERLFLLARGLAQLGFVLWALIAALTGVALFYFLWRAG